MTVSTSAKGASRLELTGWLVGHTRRLVPVLGLSALARIGSDLGGVLLLVVAAGAIATAAAGGGVAVATLAWTMVGIALAKALLRYLEQYTGHWVAFTCLQRLRELFFARLVPQAPAATTGRAGAELTDRATRDIDRIEVFFAHTLPPAVSAVLVPVIALVWLARTSGALALTLAVPVLLVLLIPMAAGRSSWRAARRVASGRGEVAGQLGDDLQGVREILAFNAGPARLKSLDDADRRLAGIRSRAGAIDGLRAGAIAAVQAGGLIAVLALAPVAGAGLREVLVALAVGIGLWRPTRGIDEFVSGLDDSFAAAARVREVVEASPLVVDPDRPVPCDDGGGAAFDRVSFGYPGESRQVLEDVTLEVEPGSWTRVVGVSGSGKSTLAGLLLRGWDADSGVVRLAGVDVGKLRLKELRRRVALVPQHPALLSGGLAANLKLARPTADDGTLYKALDAVRLRGWAAGLPEGMETELTGRGAGVSGGQLQRIAIARALVCQPDLLILDEALSQLDGATADRVREGIAGWRVGMTVLEITHRADLVPDDSPVVVLDAGRVLEAGTASRLREAGGAFARLEARG
ncbi:MAG: ABC transporter ATP-binding protein/permease [Acidipropionibacterium sp.]|jgi:ABC-type multidrug transport system fused ATPase/permease subunit|nr:ABC transporter ATP-binding protein/permease [Acidipropionibacterium sp.]